MSEAQQQIQQLVAENRVLVFMKGTADFPQCGFSMKVVNVVRALGVPFKTVNVLEDPEIREGVKQFSNWPTIPQLYVDGQFIGGSDIAYEMYQSGDLQKMVEGHPQTES